MVISSVIVFLLLGIICLFVIDDLFIDLFSLIKKVRPVKLTAEQLNNIFRLKEKNIAIMVANWHEAEVIQRMIVGNVSQIEYTNYHFFLGVYPNDLATKMAAEKCSKQFKNVHVVVNSRNGPTSKGQMLNEIAQEIIKKELILKINFDIFIMHDSEDIIHPLSLKIFNYEIDRFDFVQIPVFSFLRPHLQFIGSTYIDEFSEIHTKDLLVRSALGAAIPSAGVGTAIGRRVLLTLMNRNNLQFLQETSLTEDYILGLTVNELGFKSKFSAYFTIDNSHQKNIIATREYFPNSFLGSIKQKSRWIAGIVLQGRKLVPWSKKIKNNYFLIRDRKGPITHIVTVASILLAVVLFNDNYFFDIKQSVTFQCLATISLVGMTVRVSQRFYADFYVYNLSTSLMSLIRWPIAIIINFFATLKAFKDFQVAAVRKKEMSWSKTVHELPEGFGEVFKEQTYNLGKDSNLESAKEFNL